MKIYINDKEHISNPLILNLEELLTELNMLTQKGIAVAVNGEVIPKNSWSNYKLNEQDKLIIIKATQGG